jgi:hypothetical protein
MKVSWCSFIGEGHSGSTILSAILHSHPNICIAHEQSSIDKVIRRAWKFDDIKSEVFAEGVGRNKRGQMLKSIGMSPKKDICILGDKTPWDPVKTWFREGKNTDVFADFSDIISMPVKVLICVRDPYQHLPGWFTNKKRIKRWGGRVRAKAIQGLAKTYEAIAFLEPKNDCLVVFNEDLISDPEAHMKSLCEFLGVPVYDSWLKSCSEVVYKKPNKVDCVFSEEEIQSIENRIIKRFEPLRRYSRER